MDAHPPPPPAPAPAVRDASSSDGHGSGAATPKKEDEVVNVDATFGSSSRDPPPPPPDNDDAPLTMTVSVEEDDSEELTISPERTYVLRFDGGSRGNPGRAGSGIVLYDGMDGVEVWSGYHYLGEPYTNNEAEYRGLITGLRCALSLGVRNIVVQGDSQLILRQLEGRYKVKSPTLKSYHQEAMSLIPEFATFETSHIERARNARADELANLAMDNRASMGFRIEG